MILTAARHGEGSRTENWPCETNRDCFKKEVEGDKSRPELGVPVGGDLVRNANTILETGRPMRKPQRQAQEKQTDKRRDSAEGTWREQKARKKEKENDRTDVEWPDVDKRRPDIADHEDETRSEGGEEEDESQEGGDDEDESRKRPRGTTSKDKEGEESEKGRRLDDDEKEYEVKRKSRKKGGRASDERMRAKVTTHLKGKPKEKKSRPKHKAFWKGAQRSPEHAEGRQSGRVPGEQAYDNNLKNQMDAIHRVWRTAGYELRNQNALSRLLLNALMVMFVKN